MDRISTVLRALMRAFLAFMDDNGPQLAAAVAYYALFSLFPLLALLIVAARLLLPGGGLEPQVLNQAAQFVLLPPQVLETMAGALLGGAESVGLFALLGFLWSATGVFAALRTSLEIAWEERSRSSLVRRKLLDVAMAGIAGALLLVSIAASAALALARAWAGYFTGDAAGAISGAWALADTLVGLAVNFSAFFILYRYFPGLERRSGEVWFGALAAALGFELAKRLFLWYLQQFGAFAEYGAFGWVFALLFWAYISAAVVIYGAELVTQYPQEQRARQRGAAPAPTRRSA